MYLPYNTQLILPKNHLIHTGNKHSISERIVCLLFHLSIIYKQELEISRIQDLTKPKVFNKK